MTQQALSWHGHLLGATACQRGTGSSTACSPGSRASALTAAPTISMECVQNARANGSGGGACERCCGGTGNGQAVGKGFKTRYLPTANLHPGVLLSSPVCSSPPTSIPPSASFPTQVGTRHTWQPDENPRTTKDRQPWASTNWYTPCPLNGVPQCDVGCRHSSTAFMVLSLLQAVLLISHTGSLCSVVNEHDSALHSHHVSSSWNVNHTIYLWLPRCLKCEW